MKKPAKPGVISRLTNGVRGFIAGVNNADWMSPNQPIQQQEPDSKRVFDYPVGVNLNYQPRATEGVSFADLRQLADSYDLVRLAIETRKDQLSSLDFLIQTKNGGAENSKTKKITDFLNYPDKQNFYNWSTWLRMVIEEVLVIDAPVIWPQMSIGGELLSLRALDGSTIHRLIDEYGMTPSPPSPAYQQIIKGIPASNFSQDELIYMPRNPRVHKIYGFSPVEQIIMTINIALRRQITQLNYFTESNVPMGMVNVPEDWKPDQIEKFQQYWDAIFTGDLSNKSRIKFVPNGSAYKPFKDPDLKNEFDEWLSRVICFCFSLPPTPFVKQVNRSTAEEAQATALEEGLGPLKQYVKQLMDYIIARYFKSPEIEFRWQAGETEQDPLTKSTIFVNYVNGGIMTVDEVRQEIGLGKISENDKNQNVNENNEDNNNAANNENSEELKNDEK